MFWTRPKGIKVINRNEDFWNIASKPPMSKENIFLVKCDIRPPSPQPFIFPCSIIGQAKFTGATPSDLFADRYRFGCGSGLVTPLKLEEGMSQQGNGTYHIENLIIDGVQVTFYPDNTIMRFIDCAMLDLNKNCLVVTDTGQQQGQLIMDGLMINVTIGSLASPLLIKGSNFDIRRVKIVRGSITPGYDSIVISDYASGVIQNIDADQYDKYTNAYLIRMTANLAVEGQLVCRNLRAESSKYALYLFGKGIKRAMGEDIVVGAGLNAQGVKINDATVYNLRLWTNPAGAGAIDVSQGGMLRNSFIYSDMTNGAVEADIDTEISHCRINVPTAGRRGVHVVNVGTTRGFFNYNKGYGAGNHCDIDLAVADYTTKFNSNCNIVNPKADSAYNS